VRFALAESTLHAGSLRSLALGRAARSASSASPPSRSPSRRRIEARDTVDFETFRQQYLSPDLLRV
jgi:hypothetical protein